MNTLFKEHIQYNEEEIQALWDSALFVFDTNVLLNFYRYSRPTANALKEALGSIATQVWLPHQVGIEYFKNRLHTISGQENNYNEPRQALQSLKNALSNKRGHPYISEDLSNKFENLISEINKEFDEQTRALHLLISKDEFYEFVVSLFDGKVGKGFSDTELTSIFDEGKTRYSKKIPPGFGDKKPEPERYNDLVIWKQIVNHAKEQSSNVIFISDEERKGDWMHVHAGKTIGPLPALRKEFSELTGNSFHMYPAFRFIELAFNRDKKDISANIIDEVKEISKSSNYESNFKVVNVTYELEMDHYDAIIFASFLKDVLNTGYYIEILTDIKSEIQVFKARFPFEDLVRRFNARLEALASSKKINILGSTIEHLTK